MSYENSATNDLIKSVRSQIDTKYLTMSEAYSLLDKQKDEMLRMFKDIENNIYKDTFEFKKEIQSRLNRYNTDFEEVNIKLKTINRDSEKENKEKLHTMIQQQKKLADLISINEVKISKLEKKLSDSCFKYDKLYLENFSLAGLIGEYSKYKSINEVFNVSPIILFIVFNGYSGKTS